MAGARIPLGVGEAPARLPGPFRFANHRRAVSLCGKRKEAKGRGDSGGYLPSTGKLYVSLLAVLKVQFHRRTLKGRFHLEDCRQKVTSTVAASSIDAPRARSPLTPFRRPSRARSGQRYLLSRMGCTSHGLDVCALGKISCAPSTAKGDSTRSFCAASKA